MKEGDFIKTVSEKLQDELEPIRESVRQTNERKKDVQT